MKKSLRRSAAVVFLLCLPHAVVAGTIQLTGAITQATSDGTGPAFNNLSLNNILDADAYTVTLTFSGSLTAPSAVPYNLTSVLFLDTTRSISETAFGSAQLSVIANGSFDDLSLLACLTTGTNCLSGNFMMANFRIPAASLNLQNVPVTELDQPHPLDLLEDDGTTDIHGGISRYSYSGVSSTVPEPSTLVLALLGVLFFGKRRKP